MRRRRGVAFCSALMLAVTTTLLSLAMFSATRLFDGTASAGLIATTAASAVTATKTPEGAAAVASSAPAAQPSTQSAEVTPTANAPAVPASQSRASVDRIAITFDDGPSANTVGIVDTLRAFDCTATFFFVGARVSPRASAVRYAVESGMEVGNHTYDHHALSRPSSDAAIDAEITKADDAIVQVAGVRPLYLRPYAGIIDAAGYEAAKRTGHEVTLWTCPSCDANAGNTPAAEIAAIELSKVKPGDIMLLHETNPESAKALPVILTELKRRGWQVGSVGGLLAQKR
jgi:peptidoglycan-N-acetylglucosamine deacetylase